MNNTTYLASQHGLLRCKANHKNWYYHGFPSPDQIRPEKTRKDQKRPRKLKISGAYEAINATYLTEMRVSKMICLTRL